MRIPRMHRKNDLQRESGFTLFEVAVSMALFVIIIILTGSIFTISQRSYTTGANQSELSQNARVVLDRLSREVRQSQTIVTSLPPDSANAVNVLFFQDGHDTDRITYIRYGLSGSNLIRTHEAYYFPSQPDVYVLYNSLDAFNNLPTLVVLDASDNVVGEYFQDLKFWGTSNLVNVAMILKKGAKQLEISSKVYSRN